MKLFAFLRGAYEFRRLFVTYYSDYELTKAHAAGWRFAHCITLWRFE